MSLEENKAIARFCLPRAADAIPVACKIPGHGRTTSLPVALLASMSACAVMISSSV